MRVGRIPFQDDFILAIAIHIPHTTVVGRIGIGATIGSRSALRSADRHRLIEVSPWFHFLRHLTMGYAIRLRHLLISDDLIRMSCLAILIGIVGGFDMRSDDLAVSHHIKANILTIRT